MIFYFDAIWGKSYKGDGSAHPYKQDCDLSKTRPGKSYTGEGSGSFEKLENLFWRPKGRQQNKFRSVLFTIMKRNCCILLSHLPFGLQSCFQDIWSFPAICLGVSKLFSTSIGSMMTKCPSTSNVTVYMDIIYRQSPIFSSVTKELF